MGEVSPRHCYAAERMRALHALALSFTVVCACAQVLGLDADLPGSTRDSGQNTNTDADAKTDAGPLGPYCEGKQFDRCFDFREPNVTVGLTSFPPGGPSAITFDRAHFSSELNDFTSGPASLRYVGSGRAYRDTLKFTTDHSRPTFVLAFDLRALKKNDAAEVLATIEFQNGAIVYFTMDNGYVWLQTTVIRAGVNTPGPSTPKIQIRTSANWQHYEILYDASTAGARLRLVLDSGALGDAGIRETGPLPVDFREDTPFVTFGRVFSSAVDTVEDILLFDNVTFKWL
jgi:hypothetical protein